MAKQIAVLTGLARGMRRRSRTPVLAGLSVLACAIAFAAAAAHAASLHPVKGARPSGHAVSFVAFSGNVRTGPAGGLALVGALTVNVTPSGQIRGALLGGRQAVPVTGQTNGRSATLTFHLPGGRVVTGVGTARTPIRDLKTLPASGTLTGPGPTDRGDWRIFYTETKVTCELVHDNASNKDYKVCSSGGRIISVTELVPRNNPSRN